MTTTPNANPADTSEDGFESALETLVLESFARGVDIRGTWEITSPSSVVPNWRITIEKRNDAELPDDTSTFLDE